MTKVLKKYAYGCLRRRDCLDQPAVALIVRHLLEKPEPERLYTLMQSSDRGQKDIEAIETFASWLSDCVDVIVPARAIALQDRAQLSRMLGFETVGVAAEPLQITGDAGALDEDEAAEVYSPDGDDDEANYEAAE